MADLLETIDNATGAHVDVRSHADGGILVQTSAGPVDVVAHLHHLANEPGLHDDQVDVELTVSAELPLVGVVTLLMISRTIDAGELLEELKIL